MEHENTYQPTGNSDDSNGNGQQRPNRQRVTQQRNTSFNPNFYRENRTYKASLRDENGNYNPENRPYNRDGSNYNSERPQRNYNNNYGENRPQRSYNNNYNGENRPQRSYNNNYNGENRPQRSYNNNYNSENRPQRSYNNNYNSENRPQRSYNNNYSGEDRPQRSYNNNYNGENRPQRSYNNYNQGGGFQQRGNYNNYGNQNSNNRYQNNDRTSTSLNDRRPNYNNQDGGYRKQNYGDSYNPNAKYSQKKQFEYKQQFVDYTKPMRLNKFLANSSTCSRREADDFIVAGVVKVNGEVVTELGTKIIPATDKVHFHDQLVALEKKVYILLNKPKNCVTTSDDPQERLTVLDLVKNACSERIYPVGRLDRNTTGVILITNDGDLTSKLTHPTYEKKKIYQITLDRDFTQEDMQRLLDGIMLEDGEMKADEIAYVKEDSFKTLGVEIHSGKNRVIRRMFEHLGYKIMRLDRVYFAGLTKKNLPRGRWRYLSEAEVNMLKMSS